MVFIYLFPQLSFILRVFDELSCILLAVHFMVKLCFTFHPKELDFNACLFVPDFLRLIGLKNIFGRQLPNMPKEYIVRLVMDR